MRWTSETRGRRRWQPYLQGSDALPQRSGREVGLCIALLVKGTPAEIIIDYVRYHVHIGFRHVYLFFDDPADGARAKVENAGGMGGSVSVESCDARFWERRLRESQIVRRREENKVFEDTARCLMSEHKCRQNLVVELASERARAAGLEWLLHQDIDECFCPQAKHPHDFFANLADDVAQVLFANHEVVPESFRVEHWFREATLFKVNPIFGERDGLQRDWTNVLAWRRSTLPSTPATSFFNAYAGSKAAVRLSAEPVPYDVHKFLVLAPFGLYVVPKTRPPGDPADPVILHYANLGYEHWRRKYANLGRFPDLWWGRVPIRLPAHLLARDAVHAVDGGEEAANLYRRVVMGNLAGEMDYMEAAGWLARVDFVRAVLQRI
jgi:hypothetical protein